MISPINWWIFNYFLPLVSPLQLDPLFMPSHVDSVHQFVRTLFFPKIIREKLSTSYDGSSFSDAFPIAHKTIQLSSGQQENPRAPAGPLSKPIRDPVEGYFDPVRWPLTNFRDSRSNFRTNFDEYKSDESFPGDEEEEDSHHVSWWPHHGKSNMIKGYRHGGDKMFPFSSLTGDGRKFQRPSSYGNFPEMNNFPSNTRPDSHDNTQSIHYDDYDQPESYDSQEYSVGPSSTSPSSSRPSSSEDYYHSSESDDFAGNLPRKSGISYDNDDRDDGHIPYHDDSYEDIHDSYSNPSEIVSKKQLLTSQTRSRIDHLHEPHWLQQVYPKA
ncbi:uncharacterized protein LOC141850527 [Brevipalpus obovatus]|uniref:uncharacterized protein LOC141850527 n=1 Tax=Brevipalpus obovatus TaxID=246614 RepID=UPI003D9F70DD